MDLSYTPEELEFRAEVQSWLQANLPAEWRDRGVGGYREEAGEDIQREWQRRLYEGGWLTLGWPRERGGRGASPVLQAIYQEELVLAGAPPILGRLGVTLLAPLLSVYGSDWQKDAYLTKILSGELIFCQGFSEPNAGSDLASLQSRAERNGDVWVLNGQKTWSSGAHYANRSFLLARTDAGLPPHQGIGMFLVDMRQPGIEARPIVQMTGSGEFCEIFLSDAKVDDRDLVGTPTDGWRLAMATFGFERNGLANASRFERAVDALGELARQRDAGSEDTVRQRVAQARIEAHVFRLNGLRSLTRAQRGGVPGPEASLTKLFWSEMDKRLQETAVSVQGMYGALAPGSPWAIEEGRWQQGWMWAHAETIYAGSSEVQRNIIAERVLGLPRGR
ncbi:acyl-CoA dehydrogenase family protein [Candidatus Nephthysia bennettiae]|uniref:Acyl-CoA dehydrogenase family protein n=1 Tax=Candidatus Nephthysia bennettiae TaxID=3127016 RepID=A0A934KE85_9BACT|nr:acyl-CoA dehydrogenase family protein [Candidatus Dormibacteraeota bacterium]MBJ7610941.1 acyl-CoA dehydrogenase family protein [Candidatus Dormibacteraeota bacterium]